MSQASMLAVELLVQCLENRAEHLYLANLPLAAKLGVLDWLVKENLLVARPRKEWVTCPECQEGMARVLGKRGKDAYQGSCDHCGEVVIPIRLTESYGLALARVASYVGSGLGMSQPSVLVKGIKAWSVGKSTDKRGAFHSWYFGCGLAEAATARTLRDQIDKDKAAGSCTLITSTRLDLLERGPLANLHTVRLDSVARLGQNRFHFDWNRLDLAGTPEDAGTGPATTLRFLRGHGYVRVDGEHHDLSPQEKAFLLALIDTVDHELTLSQLREATGSLAEDFKPYKIFRRHKAVYEALIEISEVDGNYRMLIPVEDEGLEL